MSIEVEHLFVCWWLIFTEWVTSNGCGALLERSKVLLDLEK